MPSDWHSDSPSLSLRIPQLTYLCSLSTTPTHQLVPILQPLHNMCKLETSPPPRLAPHPLLLTHPAPNNTTCLQSLSKNITSKKA